MSTGSRAGIRGSGCYVPERVLSNRDFEKMVDTSDEWITTRTGIKERRIAAPDQSTSDLGAIAAQRALDDAGITAKDLDLILVATVTPDYPFPSTACLIQHKLGCRDIGAFDLSAACSGFMYAISTAAQFVRGGVAKNVLVIGAETLSRVTDYTDRGSAILFGDGAGAVIVSNQFEHGEILSTELHSDGAGFDTIIVPAGGSAKPLTPEAMSAREQYMKLRGREIYKFAVSRMVELVEQACARHSDLELGVVVPHQVNLRIIESARDRLGIGDDKLVVNIERYGNTSAASIAIAFDEARRAGRFAACGGKLVVMCAFGAGLTWGSVALRW
ncbi:MAG: ketoacyl-ACP synthase III [Planctomycetes bacterium]|nr:ketoacyl-ACP synthase III [Planctomycetota bacterium]